MTLDELYLILLYSGVAVCIGMVSIMSLGFFVEIQSNFNKWIHALIFPIILIAIGIGSLLSGRNVMFAEADIDLAVGNEIQLITWTYRVATVLILGICFSIFISTLQKNKSRGNYGWPLFFSFSLFYFTNIILNNIFGTKPVIDWKFLYPFIIFSTIFLSRNKDTNFSIQGIKFGLLFFLFGSIIAAMVLPKISLQLNYIGLPGINIRLWGLGSNPNSIGPLALIFLLLVAHKPFNRRLLQYSAISMGVCVLLLSQSKTAWGAALLSFAILWWGHVMHSPINRNIRKPANYALRNLSIPILLAFIGIALTVMLAFYSIYGSPFAHTTNEEIKTLTGRTEIWSVAIETWKNNPLFGYGSSVWDEQFRKYMDMNFAFSAHNQFLQSLSEAGSIGFIGLMIYMVTLFRYAYDANGETKGLSLALFSIILIRCFTETPLEIIGIFNGDILVHLLLFRIVLINNRKQNYFLYPKEQQQLRWEQAIHR